METHLLPAIQAKWSNFVKLISEYVENHYTPDPTATGPQPLMIVTNEEIRFNFIELEKLTDQRIQEITMLVHLPAVREAVTMFKREDKYSFAEIETHILQSLATVRTALQSAIHQLIFGNTNEILMIDLFEQIFREMSELDKRKSMRYICLFSDLFNSHGPDTERDGGSKDGELPEKK